MRLDRERPALRLGLLLFILCVPAAVLIAGPGSRKKVAKTAAITAESQKCVSCHQKRSPGIVAQWRQSRHAREGVGCLECHGAEAREPGAFEHGGAVVTVVVGPGACSGCHGEIVAENSRSHHAAAAQFTGSLDNILGEVVEGRMAAVNGCSQCHGSTVALLKNPDGTVKTSPIGSPVLDPATWPNTGIGRVNLDGSRGSCTACHSRHSFSRAMARQPEVCGKCHLGPDHPQAEIYDESKHGIAYRTRKDQMNLGKESWVVGIDYTAAPTCATCHMSATGKQPVTHDVGSRISWTLRPVVSQKQEKWETRRAAMIEVCQNCHAPDFIESFYASFDRSVDLYNVKFAQPAQKIVNSLREAKKLTPTPFDEEIEWTFYRLWHHEGRRARMGAAMQGPDFVQWHGFFEVAETFYTKFLPQAREAARGDGKVLAVIDSVEADATHAWRKGLSPEEREKIDRFYKERYGNN